MDEDGYERADPAVGPPRGAAADRGRARRAGGRCGMQRARSSATGPRTADDRRSRRAVRTRSQGSTRTVLRRRRHCVSTGALRPARLQARAGAASARLRLRPPARLHPLLSDPGGQRRARAEAPRGRSSGTRGHLRHRVPEPEQRGPSVARPELSERLRSRSRRGRRSGRPRRRHHDPRRLGIDRVPCDGRRGGRGALRPGGRFRLGRCRGRAEPGRLPPQRPASRLSGAGRLGRVSLLLAADHARDISPRAWSGEP